MKLLNKINLMLILGSFYVNAQTQESLQEKFSKQKKTFNGPCQDRFASGLVDCMEALDDERFLIQLYFLQSEKYQRKSYFEKKLTSPEEYEKFYKRFKTDEEWQLIQGQFSIEERAFFPGVYTKKQQEDDVSYRKLCRNGKYVGYGLAGVVVLATGSYGLIALYNYAYTAGAAAKIAELALAAQAAAGTVTAEKVVAGGGAVLVGALCKDGSQNKQEKVPS